MKKTVNITKVDTLKSGTNNGRSWTLFKYTCEDGLIFTSFDQRSNGPQEVDVEKEVNGRFENWKEVKPRKPNPDIERILNALAILNEKIDQLLQVKNAKF